MINSMVIAGSFAKDPTVQQVGEKNTVLLTVPIAFESKGFKKGEGEFQRTHWITMKLWGKRAEFFRGCPEGTEVVISGQLIEERWKDKQTEQWKGKFVIDPDDIQLIGAHPSWKEGNG